MVFQRVSRRVAELRQRRAVPPKPPGQQSRPVHQQQAAAPALTQQREREAAPRQLTVQLFHPRMQGRNLTRVNGCQIRRFHPQQSRSTMPCQGRFQ